MRKGKSCSVLRLRDGDDCRMLIEARNLSKVYPDGTKALDSLELNVPAGEFLFVLGPSGAGKTTLFKLIIAMEKPTSGSLSVNGIQISQASRAQILALRRATGMVFQDFRLIQRKSAIENVALALRILGLPWREIRDRAMNALQAVGLAHKWNSRVADLSLGEQQRVAIARALVKRPSLILADEPTGNLDRDRATQVMELLLDENRRGATVLVATHDLALVEALGKKAVYIKQGRLANAEW